MTPVPTSVHGGLQVAQTEDGPVTVASLEYLQQLATDLKSQSADLAAQAAKADADSADAEARAGEILVARRGDWASADHAPRIDAAAGLISLVASLDEQLTEVHARPHHGLGGLVDRVKDSHEARDDETKVMSARAELQNRYRDVASGLTSTGVAEADQLLTVAATAHQTAAQLSSEAANAAESAQRLDAELKRRRDVQSKLGFDALGIQADLELNGVRPITAGIVLKPKEAAAFQAPATLCRYATRTRYVGASHGVSIPLGHGFRYRVGSYSGHPVQSQFLAQVDSGMLVVTNQRLVFLGAKRDIATPLAKLVAVEPYADAIGIGREGKESRDLYLLSRPAELLLYLNWAVGHQS